MIFVIGFIGCGDASNSNSFSKLQLMAACESNLSQQFGTEYSEKLNEHLSCRNDPTSFKETCDLMFEDDVLLALNECHAPAGLFDPHRDQLSDIE